MLPKFWGGVPNPDGNRVDLVDHVAAYLPDPPFAAGDYWDDVDSAVRNHLVEQQLTRKDLLEKVVMNRTEEVCCTDAEAGKLSTENVIDRSTMYRCGA